MRLSKYFLELFLFLFIALFFVACGEDDIISGYQLGGIKIYTDDYDEILYSLQADYIYSVSMDSSGLRRIITLSNEFFFVGKEAQAFKYRRFIVVVELENGRYIRFWVQAGDVIDENGLNISQITPNHFYRYLCRISKIPKLQNREYLYTNGYTFEGYLGVGQNFEQFYNQNKGAFKKIQF